MALTPAFLKEALWTEPWLAQSVKHATLWVQTSQWVRFAKGRHCWDRSQLFASRVLTCACQSYVSSLVRISSWTAGSNFQSKHFTFMDGWTWQSLLKQLFLKARASLIGHLANPIHFTGASISKNSKSVLPRVVKEIQGRYKEKRSCLILSLLVSSV